jgi:hypothetical protein
MMQLTRALIDKPEATKKISAISVPTSFICILLLTTINHIRILTEEHAVLIGLTSLLIVWDSKHLTIWIYESWSLRMTSDILVTALGVWVTVRVSTSLLLTWVYLAVQDISWYLMPVLHRSLVVHLCRALAVLKMVVYHRCIIVMVCMSIDWVDSYSCLINV